MPRISFTAEHRPNTGGPTINRLSLKAGERARIAILEDPSLDFRHTLRKPTIEDGQPVYQTVERRGQQDQVMAKDFVSQVLCTGAPEVMAKDGIDSENCILCRLSEEHQDRFDPAEPRYSFNIFKYRTKSTSFDVQAPFSGEVLVWSITAKRFASLVDMGNEFGDLKKRDINLGPCEIEKFQKYDIAAAAKSVWQSDDDAKSFVKTSYKENKLEEIELAAGQKKEPRWLNKDIADIHEAWAIVTGGTAAGAGSARSNSASLEDDLSGLLASSESPKATDDASEAMTEWKKEDEAPSLDSLMSEVEEKAPAKAPAKAEEPEATDEDDLGDDEFAALMSQLED